MQVKTIGFFIFLLLAQLLGCSSHAPNINHHLFDDHPGIREFNDPYYSISTGEDKYYYNDTIYATPNNEISRLKFGGYQLAYLADASYYLSKNISLDYGLNISPNPAINCGVSFIVPKRIVFNVFSQLTPFHASWQSNVVPGCQLKARLFNFIIPGISIERLSIGNIYKKHGVNSGLNPFELFFMFRPQRKEYNVSYVSLGFNLEPFIDEYLMIDFKYALPLFNNHITAYRVTLNFLTDLYPYVEKHF
jgi:hypothetical protein